MVLIDTADDSPSIQNPNSAVVEEPESLICPITKEMYKDPVFVPSSGNTYEREAILTFWGTSHSSLRDPLTNLSVTSRDLFTNWTKRREVDSFLAKYPGYTPEGWTTREVVPPCTSSAPLLSSHNRRIPTFERYKKLSYFFLSSSAFSVIAFLLYQRRKRLLSFDSTKHSQLSLLKIPDTFSLDTISKFSEYSSPEGSNIRVLNYINSSSYRTNSSVENILHVIVPPKEITYETIFELFFPIIWLGFIALWTRSTRERGAPLFYTAFSIPFWTVGFYILKSVLFPILQQTEIVLTPRQFSILKDLFFINVLDTIKLGKLSSIISCTVENIAYVNGQPVSGVMLKEGVHIHTLGDWLQLSEKQYLCNIIMEYVSKHR